MRSKKKTKTRKPRPLAKKSRPQKTKVVDLGNTPLTYQRKEEEEFIGEHPEAFDPYVGQWVAMQGPAIIAGGPELSVVIKQACERGAPHPYVFRVESKLKPNEGFLF